MRSIHMSIPVKFAIFLAFLFLMITYVSIEIKYNKLVEEKVQLAADIETVENSIEALEEQALAAVRRRVHNRPRARKTQLLPA